MAREAAIDNVARKLLANVSKEKKKQEIVDELYREEQRSKWTKESVRPVRKQCAESFQEIVMLESNYSSIYHDSLVKLLNYIESNLFLKTILEFLFVISDIMNLNRA